MASQGIVFRKKRRVSNDESSSSPNTRPKTLATREELPGVYPDVEVIEIPSRSPSPSLVASHEVPAMQSEGSGGESTLCKNWNKI